jgi:hypothetical protein
MSAAHGAIMSAAHKFTRAAARPHLGLEGAAVAVAVAHPHQQDVGGGEVAVQHVVAVQVEQRRGHLLQGGGAEQCVEGLAGQQLYVQLCVC